jgi:hypothetical protein
MRLTEIKAPTKPLTPEQSRLKAMKQNIDRQKEAMAIERQRQQDAKQAEQLRKLHTKATGF